jgi:putative PIN family toxin of toxin-antitoxin system
LINQTDQINKTTKISKIVNYVPKIISAIFWGGKPREIIHLGRDNRVHIFTSLEIENEIAEKLRTKFILNEEEINQILLDFSTLTVPVEVTTKIEAVPDDPEDNKFIECAVLSGVNYIISGDKHLLELKEYSGIKILKASEYLAIFEKKER